MKKIIVSILFALAAVTSAFSQTYCYKILYKVDAETGVKSEASGIFYVTFIKSMTCCYESDSDGFAIKGNVMQASGEDVTSFPFYCREVSDGIYRLQNSSADILSFRCVVDVTVNYTPYSIYSGSTSSKKYKYVAFSSDYSRINVGVDKVTVGERVLKPGATPDSLY